MKNYRFFIQYDGSRYGGWQRQPDKDTIQGKLEAVLNKMTDAPKEHPVEVFGAGRTDAGVHAKKMTANAHLETTLSPTEIQTYMNRYLPDDIAVIGVEPAGDRFHARYNALGKTYQYTCYIGDTKPVFDRKYVYTLSSKPDITRMRAAASVLIGEHDFRNFCMNPRMKKTTIRKVDRIDIEEKGDYLTFTVHGTGFLQNMVRIMVGTMLQVGFEELTIDDVKYALSCKERNKAGNTAPAQGLSLLEVDYD